MVVHDVSGMAMIACRTEEFIRAGTAMRWVRRVDHRAFACRAEAAAPAARRRLNDRQASASQAALAVNFPDGACAKGPSFSSAMTCSMIAWSRWVSSAAIAGRLRVLPPRRGPHGSCRPYR